MQDDKNKNINQEMSISPSAEPKEELSVEMKDAGADSSSIELRLAFERIIKAFNKKVSPEILYSNVPMENLGISTVDIMSLAQKIGLVAELRRINILDIKTGPCIALLSKKQSYTILDDNEGYNPVTQSDEVFKPEDFVHQYTGYTIFFYEEDLSVSSFLRRTGFLFSSIGKFKVVFVEIIVISFFINLFALISPFFTMNVYDRIVPNYAISTLLVLAFGMLIMYFFDFIFKIIKSYLTDYISLNIGNEVDQVLLSKLLNMKGTGLNLSNGAKNSLFKELSMVREFYFSRFIPSLIDLPFLLMFLILLFVISPTMLLVALVASFIVFMANIFFQVPMQKNHAGMLNEDQNKNGMLIETVSGMESIKTFNYIGKILSKWRRVLDKAYRSNYNYNLWVNISTNFSLWIMNVVTTIIVVVGVFEISRNAMTTGGLIASSTIVSRIMTTVIAFAGLIVRYRSIQNTLRHLEKIVNSPMEDETENYGAKAPFTGEITFKDVTFFYPSMKHPILNKCSFTIKAKDKVAIIGKTGAGKSTITRLLLGLDFNNGGEVQLDGIDINNIHISELRSSIGFMPQKSFFFHGTVRENIMMNGTNVSEEQYQKACDLAGVKLITALSGKGDDMVVQEMGKNLSGGQQQIIALARAILMDPPILMLDEPTNGMDTSLEATFMENIRKYVIDKTFILITHKPTQLNLVERVLLIDNSTVVVDDTKEKVIAMLQSKKTV
jgi:ATP-binding cassette subfamily C protein LapB